MDPVIPDKLTVSQLVKKFPAVHGTRKFITEFTRARHIIAIIIIIIIIINSSSSSSSSSIF